MLLVAPSLGGLGGIETSGRLAWEALSRRHDHGGLPRLFSYGTAAPLPDDRGSAPVVHAASRLSAVVGALRLSGERRTVLVWHLGLLKLVPLLGRRGARVVLFLHGIEAWRRVDPVTRRLLRRVTLFLSNSAHTWQRFLRFNEEWSGARAHTVHLGLGAALEGAAPPPDPQPIALMIARLRAGEDYKGHREVIDAWPGVLAQVPSAELWIAGDGDLRVPLETRARALGEPGSSIRFVGTVSEARKVALLGRSRCLVMPSRAEGFGLVYLEAMRVGRPCLVGMDDAGREVVNPPEAGVAVHPDDRAGLGAALCGLLRRDATWDALSAGARRRYEQRFTAAHFQARLLTALRDAGAVDG